MTTFPYLLSKALRRRAFQTEVKGLPIPLTSDVNTNCCIRCLNFPAGATASAKLAKIDDNIPLSSEQTFKEESIPNWSKRPLYPLPLT
ncbi:hypothetical protein CEXT_638821 [Caerostris extrusa]|uniref:Uncharacterized protein n=1 Tax=Caerostris extrusa TaxID=172846 RepID=A0AAV4X9N6_CAEEX|nr:hypothetical protein CEXT_638821 [Caerostris extrusa]